VAARKVAQPTDPSPNGGAKSQRRVIVIRQGKLAFRFGIVRYLMALEHTCATARGTQFSTASIATTWATRTI
jgi:hypothetical protein